MPYYPTRKLTIFALDPSLRERGRVLRTQIEIPNEFLQAGPRGYRVYVVDYDSTNAHFYAPAPIPPGVNCDDRQPLDPYAEDGRKKISDEALLNDPAFHAFMTYGIVMKTLSRFEYALGRRVCWSFGGHQIKVAPHAFADANAFYTDRAQGLMFGYFPTPGGKERVYTCLSHEVVAHETTHALLDGLRERYTDPSSPQQAGFHEGLADIVAFLSILSAPEVVSRVIDLGMAGKKSDSISRDVIELNNLRKNALFGLAQQMGSALSGVHGQALRRSVQLPPRKDYLKSPDSQEPHSCGEVLVAAVLNAYLSVWIERLKVIGDRSELDRERAAEEGAEIADRMLTMCIRAIDYCPPTDLQFKDFASAVLTADYELNPQDQKYGMRKLLLSCFRAYGIEPASNRKQGQEGAWDHPPAEEEAKLCYERTHSESMRFDPDEIFRFIWENRGPLKLNEQALTRVLSVRPCVRTGRDGFVLRETVVEYHQQLQIAARELDRYGIKQPTGMPPETVVTIYGGNALVFDEYGHLKYNIGNSIMDPKKESTQKAQSDRLAYLWNAGFFARGSSKLRAFAGMHRLRSTEWYRSLRLSVPTENQDA